MKSNLNRLKRIVSALTAVCVLLAGNVLFTANADTLDDLKNESDRLSNIIKENEQKLAALKGDISKQAEFVAAINEQLTAMNSRVSVLGSRMSGINAKIAELNTKINSVNDEIALTEQRIEENNAKIEKTNEEFSSRMRALYMSGNASFLSLLLTSQDFSAFLTRSELVRRIAKNDNEIINEMLESLKALEEEKKTLAEKKQELDRQKQELVAQQSDLQAVKSDLDAQQSEIALKYSQASDVLSTMDKNSAAYKQAIRDAEQKKAVIEDKILELSNNTGSGGDNDDSTVGSDLYCPVQDPSRYVSAKFGSYPSGGAHRGYDITCNAAMGKPVYAAESGTVIIAGDQGALGNYVLIDHGGGVRTGYAHNSRIIVSVGQKVERGQQISNIGNTGYSFGPHVHFVLIKNGQYVDPEPYLPAMPFRP